MTVPAATQAAPAAWQRIRNLPRDPATGYPIPYVARWSGASYTMPPHRDDPTYGKVRGCDCQPGQGIPLLSELCNDRHRKAVHERLCQVCGCPFDAGEPYVFIGAAGARLYRDPPSHPGCSRFALRACPGLDRHMGEIEVVTCARYTVRMQLEDHNGWLTLHQRRRHPGLPVRWLLSRPAGPGRRFTPGEWLAQGTMEQ